MLIGLKQVILVYLKNRSQISYMVMS